MNQPLPRIIALLCWYDEPREALLRCVQGLKALGIDLIVALDGAYALYPDARGRSPLDQHGVLSAACAEFDMPLLDYTPSRPFDGNEVEKRTFLFKLGYGVANPGDWFFVIDADEIVVGGPGPDEPSVHEHLARTEHEAGELMFKHMMVARAGDWPPHHVTRRFYKAQPIHVATNHWTYIGERGQMLWGGGDPLEVPACDLTEVVLVEHRQDYRDNVRHGAKLAYHEAKYDAGIEFGQCLFCENDATQRVPEHWQMTKVTNSPDESEGHIMPVSRTVEVCELHANELNAHTRGQLENWGIDPDSLKTANRYTPAFPRKPDSKWVAIGRVDNVATKEE